MTRVKICGCRSVEQALWAAAAGADFVGMVFAESRRRVDPETAAEIVRALGTPLAQMEQEAPPVSFGAASSSLGSWFEHGAAALDRVLQRKRPLTVGVFAGMDPEAINGIVDDCGLDLIQMSGGEAWGACLLANRQVIKVVHVAESDSAAQLVERIQPGSAVAVMLDRANGSTLGGGGLSFDWQVAAGVASSLPLWLAGGLTAANVGRAITTVRPWCVDVSSGVETDGSKDEDKMRAFVQAVRDAG
jgi:phosphoribosylanthranilate isomerase